MSDLSWEPTPSLEDRLAGVQHQFNLACDIDEERLRPEQVTTYITMMEAIRKYVDLFADSIRERDWAKLRNNIEECQEKIQRDANLLAMDRTNTDTVKPFFDLINLMTDLHKAAS